MVNLKRHQKSAHGVVRYHTKLAAMKQPLKEIFKISRCQLMKESSNLANVAAMKQHKRKILRNTRRQCVKKSNFPANSAAMKQLQREVVSDTKKLCFVAVYFLQGEIKFENSWEPNFPVNNFA